MFSSNKIYFLYDLYFTFSMTLKSPRLYFLHDKEESFPTLVMTHATLKLNENLKNKAKHIRGSLKLHTLMKKINIHMILKSIFSPKHKGPASWKHNEYLK